MYKISFLDRLAPGKAVLLLVLCWLFGLLAGTCFAVHIAPQDFSWMHSVLSCPMSIPGAFAAAVVPFLLSAYAVSVSRPALLFLICLCKAATFSFVGQFVFQAFGTAGWLIRFLLLFSDMIAVTALFWFSVRHISGMHISVRRDFGISLGIAAVGILMDYFWISPFLAKLVDF